MTPRRGQVNTLAWNGVELEVLDHQHAGERVRTAQRVASGVVVGLLVAAPELGPVWREVLLDPAINLALLHVASEKPLQLHPVTRQCCPHPQWSRRMHPHLHTTTEATRAASAFCSSAVLR